jgi:hypothetical protein
MPGTWTEESIAGHSCDVYTPPRRNPHGFVVLYLHGVHLNRLHDKQPFVEQFDNTAGGCFFLWLVDRQNLPRVR